MAQVVSEEVTILAVGDVIVNRPDPASVFANVAPFLRQSDVVLGNLEAPICDRGQAIIGKAEAGASHLRFGPHNVEGLSSGGFSIMGLANNHGMDYGAEGLLQTIELLEREGISHAGGGRNVEEAHQPAIIERKGTRIALLAYTSVYPPAGFSADADKPGLATVKVHTSYQAPDNVLYQPGYPALITTTPDATEMARMESDIKKARQAADIVLVLFHWGVSWGYNRTVGYQKELGRAAIDAGADLIIGTHPHSIQGMELYKGRLICYCMGNFVMDHMKRAHFGADALILKCVVSNKLIKRISIIPAYVSDQWQPTLCDTEKGAAMLQKLEALSAEFGTLFSIENGEIVITGRKPGVPEGLRGLSIEPHRGLPVIVDAPLPLPYIIKKLRLIEMDGIQKS